MGRPSARSAPASTASLRRSWRRDENDHAMKAVHAATSSPPVPVREKLLPPMTATRATPAAKEDQTNSQETGQESMGSGLHSTTAIEFSAKQAAMANFIKFTDHVNVKAKTLPSDDRLKFAGQLAAEVLQRYPHLI